MGILLLSIGITVLICLLAVLILVPKQKHKKIMISADNNLDESVYKLLKMFGGDISVLLPNKIIEKQIKNSKIDKIFKESNNPWNITKYEFFVLRIVFLMVGIILDLVVLGLMSLLGIMNLWIILCWLIPLIAYRYPYMVYASEAKDRNTKFKVELPEAIDYLIMALSGGGYSLPSAFEQVSEYLNPGIIKNEFEIIINDLRSGKTMEASLESFSERAPTEGIKAFCRALINANILSVSMIDILRARAYASRKDLEMEIEKRVITLPDRVTMVLSPTSAAAIFLVAVSPAIATIMTLL